ncbi:SDR family oxidoreductase [Streptomyces sp. ISL-98]|uniref:SDR family oxidoreductase n=1 Tax=Streptomyces sp. ISL-98 TaxID=2819192 RepID=UPI0027E503BA|nr:SDR family oxidoreductase [Streptomyces sp. ISL-98]
MALQTGLAGKTALITGASRGIGAAIAAAFADQGSNLVLTARDSEALNATTRALHDAHPAAGRVLTCTADVTDTQAARACLDTAVRAFGGIDILVNNAGTRPDLGNLVDADPDQLHQTTQTNQLAAITWTALAWHTSMVNRGGAVINIVSISGLVTEHGIGYYNATKAALIHLTRQLALELAPTVRVNAIAPGLIDTHLTHEALAGREDHTARRMPLRRLGQADDVAKAAVFLAGDAASWITGHTLVVDGGATIRPNVA